MRTRRIIVLGLIYGFGGPVLASFLIFLYSLAASALTGKYPANWENALITPLGLLLLSLALGFVPALAAGIAIGLLREVNPVLIARHAVVRSVVCGLIGALCGFVWSLILTLHFPPVGPPAPLLVRGEALAFIGGLTGAVLALALPKTIWSASPPNLRWSGP
jgi:hypothetical protein